MLIRPEQITLSALAAEPGVACGPAATGKVAKARYHGHDALIAVDVAADAGTAGAAGERAPEGSV